MQEKRIHELFQASVLLKGAHALIECVGGLALAFVSTSSIFDFVNRISQNQLSRDPGDFFATHLQAWADGFSIQTQHFYSFYLLSHGVVKLALVVGLLREKYWAYPASLVVLAAFIAYQLYRYTLTHGVALLLSAFDLIVIALVWHEYRLIRRHLPTR